MGGNYRHCPFYAVLFNTDLAADVFDYVCSIQDPSGQLTQVQHRHFEKFYIFAFVCNHNQKMKRKKENKLMELKLNFKLHIANFSGTRLTLMKVT